jgi:hypothetical protein
MAIWQVDLHLVVCGSDTRANVGVDWHPPQLSPDTVLPVQRMLSAGFGVPWLMLEDWIVFGPENGNRVDIAFEVDGRASVVMRFDIRNSGIQFETLVCRVAKQEGCVFFSPDLGILVEPEPRLIEAALEKAHTDAVLKNLNMSKG